MHATMMVHLRQSLLCRCCLQLSAHNQSNDEFGMDCLAQLVEPAAQDVRRWRRVGKANDCNFLGIIFGNA